MILIELTGTTFYEHTGVCGLEDTVFQVLKVLFAHTCTFVKLDVIETTHTGKHGNSVHVARHCGRIVNCCKISLYPIICHNVITGCNQHCEGVKCCLISVKTFSNVLFKKNAHA